MTSPAEPQVDRLDNFTDDEIRWYVEEWRRRFPDEPEPWLSAAETVAEAGRVAYSDGFPRSPLPDPAGGIERAKRYALPPETQARLRARRAALFAPQPPTTRTEAEPRG